MAYVYWVRLPEHVDIKSEVAARCEEKDLLVDLQV